VDKIKINWFTSHVNPTGNILGYATHNAMLKKYCEPYFEFDSNADLVFQMAPADYFLPFKDKKNILLTMWEFDVLPAAAIKRLKYVDTLIVPSSYCRDVFKKYYHKKVEVCWEGIESDIFSYKERKFPVGSEKFRILWIGAPNARKGYQLVQQLIAAVEPFKNIEVYVKTTMAKATWKSAIKYFVKNWKRICIENKKFVGFKRMMLKIPTPALNNSCKAYGEHKNVIFDTRKLPVEELVKLYHSAHLFVFPSLGEGWGLPLCEAMATGCPCVGVGYTGCSDFFDDDVGYTIKYSTIQDTLKNYDNLIIDIRLPDTKDFVEKVIHAFTHYDEAKRKASRASDRIHTKFTWEQSARRLYELIRREYVDKCSGY
jgi:glycosyltransferase involved in cell wall biosynthesis